MPPVRWYDVRSVHGTIVDHSFRYRFPTGEHVQENGSLIFRTHDQVTASLAAVGFGVEEVYGDWDRSPVSEDPELMPALLGSSHPGPSG